MPGVFEPERYMGVWYSIQHSTGGRFPDVNCVTATYDQFDPEAGTFRVQNSSSTGFEPRRNLVGSATGEGCPNGQFKVHFFGRTPTVPTYKVLDTDYDTYAVVYNCNHRKDPVPNLWFLARTPTISEELIAKLTRETAEKLPTYDWKHAKRDV